MMFNVGQEITLEFNGKSIKSALRGWKLRRGAGYLLADKLDLKKDKVLTPQPGAEVMARVESDGVMFDISTVYAEVLKRTDLMLLAVHEDIVAKVMREKERYDCFLPVSLSQEGPSALEALKAVIFEIGHGGFRWMSTDDLNLIKGETVLARFNPGGMGALEGVKVVVMRSHKEGGKYKYACKFVALDGANEAALRRYMDFRRKWHGP